MKKLFIVLMGLCMAAGFAQADTVRLKNGKVVEGKVVERTADGVKMDVDGVTLTYYSDEIASVDSAVPAAVNPEAVAPVAVVESKAVTAPVVKDALTDMNKDGLIRKFVEVYGVKQNMQANFDQMTGLLTPEQIAVFHKSINVDEIIEGILPVYDKYFSADDLRAYIRFYESAEGKKLTQTLPLLMKDSVDISMKYLNERLPESMK